MFGAISSVLRAQEHHHRGHFLGGPTRPRCTDTSTNVGTHQLRESAAVCCCSAAVKKKKKNFFRRGYYIFREGFDTFLIKFGYTLTVDWCVIVSSFHFVRIIFDKMEAPRGALRQ
jgi:hypothetical protein